MMIRILYMHACMHAYIYSTTNGFFVFALSYFYLPYLTLPYLALLRESEADDDDDDEDEDEDKSLSDKDDQEDYAPSNNINNNDKKASKPKPPPKVSPPKKQQQQQTTKKARRTIQVGGTQKKNTKGGRRGIHALLNRLSKNVLDPSETPETSLVAALLASSKPIPAIESSTPRAALNHDAYAISMYTPQLEGIAKHWLQLHEPNAMHLELLNLLFRSVGGSPSTNLKHGTDLEELDDSEWDTLVTEVVEEMRDNDYVLLCANPAEGVAEYRDIYQEWWYRLGNVLLSHGGGTSTNTSTSTATTGFSSNRFQVELVRELVSRITELVLVGQPDLRAGATIAVLQLSLSIAERTVELTSKLQVAHRQFQSASGTQKKQTLQTNMDSWKRHKAELDEIVQGPVFQGVFIHRYRDSNPFIRVMSLQALSKLTLIRPDLFLNDKFLKYFGWMASGQYSTLFYSSLRTLLYQFILTLSLPACLPARPPLLFYIYYSCWVFLPTVPTPTYSYLDKDAMVRVTALQALLAPFTKFAKEHEYKNKHKPDILQIDIMVMKNVCTKFLGRIVDCTEDSESSQVQEMAMELLLAMLKEEFLDEWEDDHGWEQINLKALDAKTTPKVRKDALYFILEQLDSFDTTEDDDNKSQFTTTTVSEKKQVERVEGIATWIAHQLVEGTVPIEHIRVELVDHVIRSLRDMPEHRPLVVHWTAILKAIRSENPQQGRATGREEVAKQRVLLRMLACAAELEVGSSTAEEGPKTTVSNSTLHEALSLALLRSLPHLLTAFKGDVMALRSLTKLPQYLIPEVFSLPARRNDFQNLVKHLCRLFLESTDEQVLKHISHALSVLVEGGHTRLSEVKMQLKRLSTTLQDRLMELLQESDPQNTKSPAKKKKKKSAERSSPKRRNVRVSDGGDMSSDDDMFSVSPEVDVEKSIHLCLLRWRILLKRCPITYLFEESANEDEEGEVEIFYTTISEAIGKRLDDRKPIVEEDGDADDQTQSIVVPDIWKTGDMTIHPVVANTVDESLQVLNLIVTWKLYQMLEGRMNKNSEENTNIEMELDDDDDDDVDVDNLVVGQMRKRLVNLLGLCFDQFLEETEGVAYSDEHVEFVSSVQASAGRVASDVRTLFPREWSRAKDPLLSQLALTDDSQLIGGFARYLKWREPELHALAADKEEDNGGGTLVNDLLMPLARGLTANWDDGNRRYVCQ